MWNRSDTLQPAEYAKFMNEHPEEKALLALDGKHRIRSANATFYKTYQTTAEVTKGLTVYELESRQ